MVHDQRSALSIYISCLLSAGQLVLPPDVVRTIDPEFLFEPRAELDLQSDISASAD